ncbi:hypothetical protein ACWENQ_09970 [Nonomuraea sp. NPDC004354]
MAESVLPQQGMWFEHALEYEMDPQNGIRPARCVVTCIAEPGVTVLPQVLWRRLDDSDEDSLSSIDTDLFDDVVLRWLTPEECALAVMEARFHEH